MQELDDQVVSYVVERHGRFPERVVAHFGEFRQTEVEEAIDRAVASGRLVRRWFEDRTWGQPPFRYAILLPPGQQV